MHKPILNPLTTLIPLITSSILIINLPTQTNASPTPLLPPQPCPSPTTPLSFTLASIAYVRSIIYYAPGSPQQHNTTQLVFELTNPYTGITTGCACEDVMDPESGEWADHQGRTWFACLDRSIPVSGSGSSSGDRNRDGNRDTSDDTSSSSYPVRTIVRVDWDLWRVTVNQTWGCDDSVTTSQFSVLTLEPTCTENRTGSQYIKECTAPDLTVSATPNGRTV